MEFEKACRKAQEAADKLQLAAEHAAAAELQSADKAKAKKATAAAVKAADSRHGSQPIK